MYIRNVYIAYSRGMSMSKKYPNGWAKEAVIESTAFDNRRHSKRKRTCKDCINYKITTCKVRPILFCKNEDTWCMGCGQYKHK